MSSRKTYSAHGFDARMSPSAGHVCHSLVVSWNCRPGSAHSHAVSAMSSHSSRAGSVATGCGRPALDERLGALGAVDQVPLVVALDRAHEVGRDADGVVRVLAGDGVVRLALPVGVVLVDVQLGDALPREVERALDGDVGHAGLARAADGLREGRVGPRDEPLVALDIALGGGRDDVVEVHGEHPRPGHERGHLGLLDGLPADVALDVGMVEVERHHLRGAARGAARLDGARGAVADLQEAHQAGRAAAARQALVLAADVGEVGAGAGAVLEDAGLAHPQVHDAALVDEVVGHGLDEAGVRGRALVGARGQLQLAVGGLGVPVALRRAADAVRPVQARVEPLRRVGRGGLAGEHGLELVVERVRVLLAEVAVREAPVGPAAGQAAEHLARVGLPLDRRTGGRLGPRQPLGHAVLRRRARARSRRPPCGSTSAPGCRPRPGTTGPGPAALPRRRRSRPD